MNVINANKSTLSLECSAITSSSFQRVKFDVSQQAVSFLLSRALSRLSFRYKAGIANRFSTIQNSLSLDKLRRNRSSLPWLFSGKNKDCTKSEYSHKKNAT